MLSKLKSLAKEPTFWVVVTLVAIGVAAFSKFRSVLKPVASKVPGNDVMGSL